MKSVLKFTITFGTSLLLLGGCSIHNTNNTPKQDITQNQFSETRTYFAVLPCASCPGIKTWIRIDKSGRFSTIEEYLEEKDSIFMSDGKVVNKGNSVYSLTSKDNSGDVVFKDDSLCLLDGDKKINKQYCLEKLDEFSVKNQNLFIYPKSVKKGDDTISFNGVLNFAKKQNSLSANFKLNKNYETKISNVKYFKHNYALGDEISKDEFFKNQGMSENFLKKDLADKIFESYDMK